MKKVHQLPQSTTLSQFPVRSRLLTFDEHLYDVLTGILSNQSSIRVKVIMPLFDLITNVKEVPANFHKETTELIASQLGKPSSVSAVNLATFVELS